MNNTKICYKVVDKVYRGIASQVRDRIDDIILNQVRLQVSAKIWSWIIPPIYDQLREKYE
jgi:hypothetical protein